MCVVCGTTVYYPEGHAEVLLREQRANVTGLVPYTVYTHASIGGAATIDPTLLSSPPYVCVVKSVKYFAGGPAHRPDKCTSYAKFELARLPFSNDSKISSYSPDGSYSCPAGGYDIMMLSIPAVLPCDDTLKTLLRQMKKVLLTTMALPQAVHFLWPANPAECPDYHGIVK